MENGMRNLCLDMYFSTMSLQSGYEQKNSVYNLISSVFLTCFSLYLKSFSLYVPQLFFGV